MRLEQPNRIQHISENRFENRDDAAIVKRKTAILSSV